MRTAENIRAILRYSGKIQHSSALPNIKYNCVVLIFSQLYVLFFILPNIFSQTAILKPRQNFLISSQNAKLVNFLQADLPAWSDHR